TNSGSGSITQNSTGVVLFSSTFNNSGAGSTFTQSSNGTTTFSGDVNNSGTITHGSGAISVAGTYTNNSGGALVLGSGDFTFTGDYTNNGTFTAGTGNAVFSGNTTTQHLKDGSTNGTVFKKVLFSGDQNKNMQTGHFYVAPTGIMTLSGNTTHAVSSNSGNLTFMSDANSSATVAAIPNSCSVNGPVTVQRYVTASRSYRLVSSPVADTTAAGVAVTDASGNNIYSINYLRTNSYVTGSGGGVDKTGNPTLYLYRENLVPNNSTFTGGNFRGISDLTASPSYTLDIDGGPFNIPVGNGYLFFFRGSRKQATLAALTVVGAAATNDTLNAVGALNQGNINVHHWYTPASANLMYSTTSGSASIEGFNLVGNPYASSIDWDKFSNSNSAFAIYGPGLSPIIALLNPTGQTASGNYGYYDPTISAGTNNATNIIPTGVGFFVQASPSGLNTLRFSEAAKVNTQVTSPNLFMGKPVAEKAVPAYLHLRVAIDSANSDETIIAFNAANKPGYDMMEDARYRVGTSKIMLSSISSDNVALGINHLPLSKGAIPLKLAATAGNYTIKVKHLSGIPAIYAVWLKDAFTKDSVNLRTTSSYSFTVNTADTTTFGSKRFSVVIATDPANAYQLLTFTGNRVGNSKHVELDWTTKNEQNYTHFTVERSNDNGKTFEVVGGMLSSGQGTYSLTDKNALNGDNLYRLKQEDITNTITYSNVADITITTGKGNDNHLTCYPNPAINNISVCIPAKAQEKNSYALRISNSSGIVVKYAVLTDVNWQGNVSNFLSGTYLIQVIDKKNNTLIGQTKFVKL
ncbi:MAG TPA: T9SS type A sorting domain-containing protein, partial [Mucilaginibacter sp.]|nr:T9SS type A sorting domain-containing protein [Mucilaginibacter sp.]